MKIFGGIDYIGLDITLDYSEYYDFFLSDNERDFVYIEYFGRRLYYMMTENGINITTEDNYRLIYD